MTAPASSSTTPASLTVTLPDGTAKGFPTPCTAHDVAASIGEGLAKAALGAKVDGELYDLHRPLPGDCALAIVTAPRQDKKGRSKWRDEQHEKDALYLLRHSTAHVMAEAICKLWPDTQLAYGPPLENGFYYDLKLDTPISSDDFGKIEEAMGVIVNDDREFRRYELDTAIGLKKLDAESNKYKLDNAARAIDGGASQLSWYVTGDLRTQDVQIGNASGECLVLSMNGDEYPTLVSPLDRSQTDSSAAFAQYGRLVEVIEVPEESFSSYSGKIQSQGNWEDLCQGPHVDRTSRIGAFKVMSVASSHWHGDVNSDRFQRVYGTAFFSQADLDAHLEALEQAKERDHRVIGKRLSLFDIDEAVGQGLILWKPKGAVVRQELQDFISEHLERQGYSQVFTPHIGKLGLYKTSGHYPYYQESQFPPLIDTDQIKQLADENCSCGDLAARMKDGDIEGYMLKPMNCPMHIKIFDSEKRSYRDLPVRLAEFGTVYRWEQSGELGGMTRVRGFTQDDAHLFCTPDQVSDELLKCLELVKTVFNTLGMSDYRVRVGLRDTDSTKFVGKPEDWDAAEEACRNAAKSLGVPFSEEPGEAAFYGPKIDFVVKDVIGREWQLGTVQVDYQLPQRFDLKYTGSDNAEHRPVMIHRAPFGSMERFIGCLIEHFGGAFPLWLSPEQVRVLPISDKFIGYAEQVEAALKAEGLRASVDTASGKIGGKIADAQQNQVPYMLVVGGKDEEAGTVSVRHRRDGDTGAVPLAEFVAAVTEERDERAL